MAQVRDSFSDGNNRGVIAADGTTKARIERAAVSLFTQRGVDGVSIKEIAARANISDGGMYRYYPAKYALAGALMLEIHNRLTKLVRDIEAADMDFEGKIKTMVQEYCAMADDDWELFAYHLLHLHHFPQIFTAKTKRSKVPDSPVTACTDILDAAMGAGDIPTGNKELLASMALGIIVQAASAKTYGRLKGKLSVYAPDFERAILALLKA